LIFAYLVVIAVGYFMGCIQSSYIIGRMEKIDIREYGSNNAGASNAFMVLGWKKGVIVGVIDILKSAIPVFIVTLIFKENDAIAMTCGVATTVGHIFPIFMGFRGGKGTASIAGTFLGLNPLIFVIVAVTIMLISFISNYIAVGTFALHIAAIICLITFGFSTAAIWIYVCVMCLNLFLHYPNFRRILKGKETKFRSVFKKS